ncbi:unnamed protein product, partial [Discosporangium mesarthrocarpum]
NIVRTPFYRQNLVLRAMRAPDDQSERTKLLGDLLVRESGGAGGKGKGKSKAGRGGATVVYVTFQKTATVVAEGLRERGIDARAYHAGMPALERAEVQDWFMGTPEGESPVIVGTIAFGMGLDKSNVRRIYHFNLPRSPEDLAQQARSQGWLPAGRDGGCGQCLTLVSPADLPQLKALVQGNTPSITAVRGLLGALFAEEGRGRVDFSMYELSQALDTKELVLKTMLAHLQMAGYARETTSFFEAATAALTPRDAEGWLRHEERARQGHALAPGADELLELISAKKKVKWATLNIRSTAETLGVSKLEVLRLLQSLSDDGLIITGKPGKIRSRYKILRYPTSSEDIEQIAVKLHQEALKLEERELERLQTVVEILCSEDGGQVSSRLSRYFGDTEQTIASAENFADAPSQQGDDGVMSTSRDPHLLQLPPLSAVLDPIPPPSENEVDQRWVTVTQLIARGGGGEGGGHQLPVDDPYLLARFAAGIRTPRISKLGLWKLPEFGCCEGLPFPKLLERARVAAGLV